MSGVWAERAWDVINAVHDELPKDRSKDRYAQRSMEQEV